MVTKVYTGAITGIDCRMVCVEVDVSNGLPQLEMVGRLSSEVREAEKRVRVALKNTGITLPPQRITVNLAPADLYKEGTQYDLAIAIGMLASAGMLPAESVQGIFIAGELGLQGDLGPVRGILPMVLEGRGQGFKRFLLPEKNAKEGAAVSGIEVVGLGSLREVYRYLGLPGEVQDREYPPVREESWQAECGLAEDFADLYGQETVKRVMEIAAAGFHNVLMIGPPGAGKTMAARRLPGILPPITEEESLEVSRIYSVAGLLGEERTLVKTRPFVAPHHSATLQALAGGGRIPRPGLISQAHKGVLFLDEVVHFSSAALEVLRQPMEEKKLMIARSTASYEFPADFMLVAALNPCPCGNYPDTARCRCTPQQVRRYLGRLSGPLLDRIDLCVEMGRMNVQEFHGKAGDKIQHGSITMRERVMAARQKQQERLEGTGLQFNAQMGVKELERLVPLGQREQAFIDQVYEKLHLSLRSYHRIIKVARTIADLEDAENIALKHIQEALCYRGAEDRYWG
ncbi:MAG: YifB family Mg chelatase-like AAA ATPase [Lachnospiraceae bacterium]|nr:YifB family Mg chelatase-like AAA ATPase [Lachnospiraceae bacterium]